MATPLERAIYSIAYYWQGITKRGVLGILWLYDKMYHLELLSWSNVSNLPYNQVVVDKIDEMIMDGHLIVTDRWIAKFGNIGLQAILSNNSPELYKVSDRFSDKFRMIIKYYIGHTSQFKSLYVKYQDKGLPTRTFYNYITELIMTESRQIK